MITEGGWYLVPWNIQEGYFKDGTFLKPSHYTDDNITGLVNYVKDLGLETIQEEAKAFTNLVKMLEADNVVGQALMEEYRNKCLKAGKNILNPSQQRKSESSSGWSHGYRDV